MQLHPDVAALTERVRQIRRDLHRIPELSFEEVKTQQYILDFLAPLKPDVLTKIAGTGVKAVFLAKDASETVAFRADIDALSIQEQNDTDYASETPERMHACGHDGHVSMQLLTAELVGKNRAALKRNVVFLFQPAEEGGGGARRMIAAGALENPKVDRIYGAHVWPSLPAGKIGVRWGPMMALTQEFDITVKGVSAHAASPQMGIDAVVVAAELISMLQTAITRSLDPHNDALLTIGRIDGGVARNIIAEKVVLNATLRVLDDEAFTELSDRIRAMLKGISMATGAKLTLKELMRYPRVENPRPMVEDFYRYLDDMEDTVLVEPVMAAEDFACYQEQIPGLFFFLGIGEEVKTPPLHSGNFDFDEENLLTGVEIFRRLALK
ncbi:MAG: M20 family metallopeptidase [Firmicutes bacterium]|nr:M20 family metallopeptidase [Bacillota bacterium]